MKLLLKNANIIRLDLETIAKGNILIEDGLIQSIDQNISCDDLDIQVMDCQGKWIMPGLIDMHVHIKSKFAPLFTACGVTTVRNTGGSILELEDMIHAKMDAVTPRVISSDRVIDGEPGLWGPTSPYSVNIEDVSSAVDEVKRQVKLGANLIKVYGWLKADVMKAVCDEAKKHQVPVSCDLMYATQVNALEAAKMGVTWFEHASGMIQILYPDWAMQAEDSVWQSIDWDQPNMDKVKDLCQELLKYDVKLCPTLTLYDQGLLDDHPWKPKNPVIDKIEENKSLINQWQYIHQSGHMKNKVGIQTKVIKAITKTYHSMGGCVVCGTDTPAGVYTYPGMALHRELEIFVEIGYSEFEAIKAASLIPANALGRKDLGRICQGAVADLVILNSNPIQDITKTRDICYVIKGGSVFRPKCLMDSVPSDEMVNIMIEDLIEKFKSNGLPVDMFN